MSDTLSLLFLRVLVTHWIPLARPDFFVSFFDKGKVVDLIQGYWPLDPTGCADRPHLLPHPFDGGHHQLLRGSPGFGDFGSFFIPFTPDLLSFVEISDAENFCDKL